MCTDEEDEALDKIIYSRPISREEMLEMEKSASAPQRGLQRRLALLACSSTLEELAKLNQQDPASFLDMRNCIKTFKVHTKAVAEIAETAAFRMELADLAPEPANHAGLPVQDNCPERTNGQAPDHDA